MWRANSFEETLMLGKIEGRRRRGWQRMRWLDGITESMHTVLGRLWQWWWTGRPGVLWFMGSQRVGHDWATELNWLSKITKFERLHSFVVVQLLSHVTLCDPMDCSTPGFFVLHYLSEFAQTHVHWVSDAIQTSHFLLPSFSSCPKSFPESRSFPMGWLFTSGGQSIELQHQSFQWIIKVDLL